MQTKTYKNLRFIERVLRLILKVFSRETLPGFHIKEVQDRWYEMREGKPIGTVY